QDRGHPLRPRSPRQALLPPWPHRQGRPHRRAPTGPQQGHLAPLGTFQAQTSPTCQDGPRFSPRAILHPASDQPPMIESPDTPIDLLTWERQLWEGGYTVIAGVDEVGRGALAGPLVAAAVVLPDEDAGNAAWEDVRDLI